ncbi:MAG: hypothetical protein AAF462_07675 [Thermodesulfobacteriota bacterium]
MSQKKTTRLYAILARNAANGVIFRRGPTAQVLLIKWNLNSDTFELGQWFKGRIYERRCDLSPSGTKLVYFAGNFKTSLGSWTAVSKPPYLTALMLWPKGDAWGGGGLFENEYTLHLNHRDYEYNKGVNEMELMEGYKLPKNFKIKPFGERSGWGEDDPIWRMRLERDGWTLIEGKEAKRDYKAKIWITYDPPIIYRKPLSKNKSNQYFLEMKIMGIKERKGPWYVIEYDLINTKTLIRQGFGRLDWADWDIRSGDFLFASQGKLFRIKHESNQETQYNPNSAIELADFSDLSFEAIDSPNWAKVWK